ncbi:MAG: hypothetical protein QOJ83_571, partial [Frankiales bacterium]|nr:hypothetical protein [Frankiales bacterium]
AAKSAMTKACVAGSSLGGACSAFNNFSSLGVLGALGGGATSASGRLALGISVADKVATMTVRELGHKASASKATVGDEIKKLPADTTGAIAFGDVSTGIDQAFTSIGTAFGAVFGAGMSASASGGMAYASAMAPTPMSSGATDGLVYGSAAPSMAPGVMTSAMAAMPSAFPAAVPSGPADASVMPGLTMQQDVTQFDPTKAITDSLKQVTGLTFPGDFTALLGDRSVVAVGDVPLSASSLKDLQVGIRSHPQDLGKAQTLAQTLIQHVSSTGIPFTLATKTAGDDFVLASSQSYADALAGTGKLGDSAQFADAMGDLSGAHFAAYVDLSKFTGILSATRQKAYSGFKALGIVERTDGADAVIQLKLLAG